MVAKVAGVNRAVKHDFTPFTNENILQVYNAFSPRKMAGFMDQLAMRRRVEDLLDMHGLMVYHEDNGGALYKIGSAYIYRAEAHPHNIKNLGFVHRDSNKIIHILVSENPKQTGSKAAKRFALYREGMTVYEYYMECRNKLGGNSWHSAKTDIDYDQEHGFIRLEVDKNQEISEHAQEFILK